MLLSAEKAFELTGHRAAIYAFAGSTDGRYLYSAGADRKILRWEIATQGSVAPNVVAEIDDVIYSLICLDKDMLIAGGNSGNVYFIDKKNIQTLDLRNAVFCLRLIAEKGKLLVACAGGHVHLLSIPDHALIKSIRVGESDLRSLDVDAKNNIFATGGSDNVIRLFDLESFSEIRAIAAHDSSVFSLAFTRNGRYILSGGRDAQLKAWKAHDLALLETLPAHLYTINDIQWAGERPFFFTASRDKSIKIWDGKTLGLLKVIDRAQFPESHSHSVNKLYWDDKNSLLFSAGDDRRICAWKVNFM